MTAARESPVQSVGTGERYRLDDRIATGGMGEVWRATDTVLGRVVAVKVLKNEYADDPLFRSRFESEARNAAALHHPGVASVFDFGGVRGSGDSPAGRPYLVMELVPGRPLSALLRGGEPLPPATAADLVAQAAEAIAVAHAQHIVHRDVKPANLMVTPKGQVKITDFGIARAADGLALTNTGEVIGTPHYISPEQAEGKPATAASDIYGLGVILYECLAGHRPFDADTPVAIALAHLRTPVPPLPERVPEHLRQVTEKALAKAPADRFATAADLATALRGEGARDTVAGAAGGFAAGGLAGGGLAAGGLAGAGGPPAGTAAAEGTSASGASAATAQTKVLTASSRRRRRLPGGYWPVVAAAAAVLLVIALISVLGGDGSEDDTAAGDPTQTRSGNKQAEDQRIRVRKAAYLGMETSLAQEKLQALGFDQVREEKTDNPTGKAEGTVASVNPRGLVEPTAEITLVSWDSAPEPAQSGDEDSEGTGSDGTGSDGTDSSGTGSSDTGEEPGQDTVEPPEQVAPGKPDKGPKHAKPKPGKSKGKAKPQGKAPKGKK